LALSDPDGGEARKTLTSRTRPIPPLYAGERFLNVYPEGFGGEKKEPSFTGFNVASKELKPGDVLLMHPGSYPAIQMRGGGTEKKPVVIRAAPDGEVIVHGAGEKGNVIELDDAANVQIEGLHILG